MQVFAYTEERCGFCIDDHDLACTRITPLAYRASADAEHTKPTQLHSATRSKMRTDGIEYRNYGLFNITADKMRVFGGNLCYQFASDHSVTLICQLNLWFLMKSLLGQRINLSFAVG